MHTNENRRMVNIDVRRASNIIYMSHTTNPIRDQCHIIYLRNCADFDEFFSRVEPKISFDLFKNVCTNFSVLSVALDKNGAQQNMLAARRAFLT
jgi:hypothetical protein